MKRRFTPAGYTILEVLIVLAVSSGLFIIVSVLFTGKQGQTEMYQGVRDLEARVQTVASETANGYYPNGYKCVANDTGSQPTLPGGSVSSGENIGCIFLGKVLNFGGSSINVITVVGRQYKLAFGSAEVSNLAEAKPLAVAKAGGPDVTSSYSYGFGLKVTKITKISDNTEVGAIAFIAQLGSSAGGNPMTGSRTTLLYALPGTSPNNNNSVVTASLINDLGAIPYPSLQPVPEGLRLCLLGSNGKKAEITIGEGGNQVSTAVLVDNGVGSEC